MDPAIRGRSSLHSRASPLQGCFAPHCGEAICTGGLQSSGGEVQTQFKALEGVVQQFWQEQSHAVVSGFDLELVAMPYFKKNKVIPIL